MANEVRLIEELRRLADLTPPVCHKDQGEDVESFGRIITVYCKPFEQFQDTVRRAADRIEELESLRPKGRWEEKEYGIVYGCSKCGHLEDIYLSNYCPNCGAKMEE